MQGKQDNKHEDDKCTTVIQSKDDLKLNERLFQHTSQQKYGFREKAVTRCGDLSQTHFQPQKDSDTLHLEGGTERGQILTTY